jgi:hypothetical protein
MKRTIPRTAALLPAMVALSGCLGLSTSSGSGAVIGRSMAAVAEGTNLKDVCPATIVVQTDWHAEAEHGLLYQLLGPHPVIDKERARITAELVAGAKDTGVKLEIREGGPAAGFKPVSVLLYDDPAITLGFVSTDEAIAYSSTKPTVGIVAPLDKDPQAILWDPATYPDVQTITDLGAKGVKVRYLPNATYMEFLVGRGILKREQVDASYDGKLTTFVELGGQVAQQGFGSAEPYEYLTELDGWHRPVRYQYVDETGYRPYRQVIAARPDVIGSYSKCFAKLVPILQQSTVDFVRSPDTAIATIESTINAYANGWKYSIGNANYAVRTLVADRLVGNGPDATLGNFDLDRIDELIKIAGPILQQGGAQVKQGLAAGDLATNQFVDPTIGL